MTEQAETTKVHTGPARERGEAEFSPFCDIYELSDGTTVLEAELPGATNDSLEITVDKGVLTISASGELPEVDPKYARSYSGFVGGRFYRAFALSDEVDRDNIQAHLADGVLTLKLPRAAAARTRKIQINAE